MAPVHTMAPSQTMGNVAADARGLDRHPVALVPSEAVVANQMPRQNLPEPAGHGWFAGDTSIRIAVYAAPDAPGQLTRCRRKLTEELA